LQSFSLDFIGREKMKAVVFAAVLFATGCASPIIIVDQDGNAQQGVPFPVTALYDVEGLLTQHTSKKACNPMVARQKLIQPTGEFLYARSGSNFFTSSDLSVSYTPTGMVASIGGKTSAPVSGVVETLGALVPLPIFGPLGGDVGERDDARLNCDTGFVPQKRELAAIDATIPKGGENED